MNKAGSINDILFDVRGNGGDLVPLKETDAYSKKVEKELKAYGIDVDKVFYDVSHLVVPFYYIDEPGVYIEIYDLEIKKLEMFDTIKKIEVIKQRQIKFLEEQSYEQFYNNIVEKFKFKDFEIRYKDIPREKLFEVFADIYTDVEFNFSTIPEELIQNCFLSAPKYSDSNDEVTIYRGAGSKSIPVEKSHSWTTDPKIALFFSIKNIDYEVEVIKAKIKKKDIVAILDDRGESEVLCNYKDLYEVETIIKNITNMDEILLSLSKIDKDMVDEINLIKNLFSDSEFSKDQVIRMLALYNLMKENQNISEDLKEFDNIIKSAIILSNVDKYEDKNINPYKLNSNEMDLCKRIIKNHQIDDNQEGPKKEVYELFKDLETLNIANLKDLDFTCLNNESSYKYILLATIFYKKELSKRYLL